MRDRTRAASRRDRLLRLVIQRRHFELQGPLAAGASWAPSRPWRHAVWVVRTEFGRMSTVWYAKTVRGTGKQTHEVGNLDKSPRTCAL